MLSEDADERSRVTFLVELCAIDTLKSYHSSFLDPVVAIVCYKV